MKRLILIALAFALMGCTEYRMTSCRHRAVECALLYGEKYGPERVGIAIGPTATPYWHGQAYYLDPSTGERRWIRNLGHACEVSDQEPFQAREFYTVRAFMQNNFGQF